MDSLITETFTLFSLGLCVILFRTWSRWKMVGWKGFEVDDYLMLLVIIPYITETMVVHAILTSAKGLTNGGMTDGERAALDPESEEFRWRVLGSKLHLVGWTFYVTALWGIKITLCSFYLRLTAGLPGYRIRILAGFILIGVTYTGLIFSLYLPCPKIHMQWQIYPDPGNFCQPGLSKVAIFATVVLNIITDVYLISIPIPVLWRTQLPTIQKIGLVVVFSGGAFVMVAGLLRCVLILQDPINGPKQSASWAIRESFVAVVTSSLPMIWPVLRRWLKRFVGSVLSSNKESTLEPGSIMLAESGGSGAWGKHRTQTTVTANNAGKRGYDDGLAFDDGGSEDGIIPKGKLGTGIRKDTEVTVSTQQAGQ